MTDTCKKIVFLSLLTIMGTRAFSDTQFRSKLGFEFRGLRLPQQSGVGWVAGLQTGRYLGTSNVYYGLSALFGAPTGDSIANESIYYGGFILGKDGRLSKVFIGDINLLVGYGAGKVSRLNQSDMSYYVVEPTAGLGFSLGGGCRLKFEVGYTYMTNTPNFSGYTFGFRIDFRSAIQSKDIND